MTDGQMQMQLLELEEFEGKRPAGTRLKLTGLAPQRTSGLHRDEELVLIVRAKVRSVQFVSDQKVGLLRVHSAAIEEAYVLPDDGERSPIDLLDATRIAHKEALDQLAGTPSFDDLGTDPDTEDAIDELERDLEVGDDDEVIDEIVGAAEQPSGEDAEPEPEPWAGYDGQTVSEVVDELGKVIPGEPTDAHLRLVRRVLGYEEAHGGRKGVTSVCRQLIEALEFDLEDEDEGTDAEPDSPDDDDVVVPPRAARALGQSREGAR